jgi:hypothetical protein
MQTNAQGLIYTLEACPSDGALVTGWASFEDAAAAVRDGEWFIAPSRFLSEIEADYREDRGRSLLRPDGAVRFRQKYPDWMCDGRWDNKTRTLTPTGDDHWKRLDAQREFDARWRARVRV